MLWIEQAFGQQPGLELFEGRLQCAGPGVLQVLNNQLELAAALIQGYPAAQADSIAVLWGEFNALVAVAKHGAAHLGTAVFQGEVPMAR